MIRGAAIILGFFFYSDEELFVARHGRVLCRVVAVVLNYLTGGCITWGRRFLCGGFFLLFGGGGGRTMIDCSINVVMTS